MDHDDVPVLNALAEYHRHKHTPFTPPGHKQGRGADPRVRAVLGDDVFRNDVLAISGLDDRSSSGGVIQRAQELMADAVGADQAFFSTCGSSLSVKSAMLAVAGRHGRILVGRDVHKSVISGLVLSGLQPAWVHPRYDAELHLAHPPSPESIERALDREPDVGGVLITSPTPYGTCADIAAIAQLCHGRGLPLLVDEAWGAHLPFHEQLPTWAMDAGADLCVVSIHKMGAGLEQGSVFHLQGDLIDPAHLSACADMLATTSPNVLVYAAMDGWRRQMVQHGHDLLSDALDLAGDLRQRITKLPGLHVLHDELIGAEASHELDPLKVIIDVAGLGISGYQAADWLRAECAIDMGLSDHRRVEAQLTIGDDETTSALLLDALASLPEATGRLPEPPPVSLPAPEDLELDTVMLPRDAFFARTEDVHAEDAAGRICAEQVTPYPPGIPVLLPGERIGQAALDYLRSGVEAGMVLPDPANPQLETIRVVA
ncbi:aminotransferase class I/II-fold pyridoxal phosphate-dependent enzyme [Pseudonocardia sp.]|jgi:arginine/lysine/ornithine decarboxylase|uniref:aminotransferase class I/II-fold pyridoxal phosphate-dependent enzyme n=1 Tax=Pseudonocardia sp. TaxID=60912 RepID=UPI002DA16CB0|nr:aminotransferase class I/II-fold pyridoxal phosphate-dependent enzyme [Pseudonocardia sp.]